MSNETYLSHPNFGLLYSVCPVESGRELYTTLYAQRLFFVVNQSPDGLEFEPVGRSDARMMVETRLRLLRRLGRGNEYDQLQKVHKQTFL